MVSQQDHEHAIDDAKTSNDLARVGATSTILINGGAASATLAFIGSMARDTAIAKIVLTLLPVPLFVYALGVFFAAVSLLVMSKSIESYMNMWLGSRKQRLFPPGRFGGLVWASSLSGYCALLGQAHISRIKSDKSGP